MPGQRTWLTTLLVVAMVTIGLGVSAVADSGSEQGFLSAINSSRASQGLAPLQMDGGLRSHARSHTADMIAFLKAPGHTLELIEYRAPASKGAVKARPCDAGFAHVAFNVDDAQAAVAAAERYGVRPIAAPVAIDQGPNKGRKVVYLRDWDGITIELIEARAR